MGKGVISDEHPNSLGVVGFMVRDYQNYAFEHSDVIITVGYDLLEFSPTRINPKADKQIIHIRDMDAEPAILQAARNLGDKIKYCAFADA